jgi:hypothetical protein
MRKIGKKTPKETSENVKQNKGVEKPTNLVSFSAKQMAHPRRNDPPTAQKRLKSGRRGLVHRLRYSR